jgi:hypothetical protein
MKKKVEATTRVNPRLEFSKAIQALTTKQDAFVKAIEALEQFKKEELIKFDLELEAKQEELKLLDEEFKHKLKNKQIECDQQFAEYGYKTAMELLKERDETSIGNSELQRMKEELSHLRGDVAKKISDAVEAEKAESKRALSAAIGNATLTHKAETAVLTATVEQQKKEIASLNQTIANLTKDIAAQRDLTKEVAMASRQAPITQQIGKQ